MHLDSAPHPTALKTLSVVANTADRDIIVQALKYVGGNGANNDELAELTGLSKDAVFRRMKELETANLAHRRGKRSMILSGRAGDVWYAGAHPDPAYREKQLAEDAIEKVARALVKLPQAHWSTVLDKAFALVEPEGKEA